MNQQPMDSQVQLPTAPTAEEVTLFNAGIAWLAIAGLPPVELGNAENLAAGTPEGS